MNCSTGNRSSIWKSQAFARVAMSFPPTTGAKLYFGTDRIIQWQGGTVAYATSVKSVPVVLSSARDHGLENYPDFYTVNSEESTQFMGLAGDIIRYMAEGPLSIAKPYQITDDPKSIADKMLGDLRGLPTALV